jgi:hypothetical protein
MKLKFHEKMSGAQITFHAQNEKSMNPENYTKISQLFRAEGY